ncbi:MAG TPA: hypothetical protein DEP69_04385, partial [Acidimicrobiaceae bacterium]|nr:hypothetical protein [Acidimicrobiaceae bacterium]
DEERGADGGPASCDALATKLAPLIQAPPGGAYELVAGARTVGRGVSPFQYLTAVFELGLWRPVDLHPGAADNYRAVAADTRRTSAASGEPCEVTALWIAAAVAAEIPNLTRVNDGTAVVGSSVYDRAELDIVSVARSAARRGCAGAAALAAASGPDGGAGGELGGELAVSPFWSRAGFAEIAGAVEAAV